MSKEYTIDELKRLAVKCPHCGSLNVKSITSLSRFTLAFACRTCRKIWRRPK